VKNLYNESCKTLKKQIEEDPRRWKDHPCSWISRINIVKMIVLLKGIDRFSEIPIKIPTAVFPQITKTILSKGITLPDFKSYYRAIVTKAAWYWYTNIHRPVESNIEDPEITPTPTTT
jgi:hypothetical protein